jgi:hypothetical protein
MVYMLARKPANLNRTRTAKNTVTLNSAEGDVSEAGAQVRTTKKLEPEVSQHALPLSSSSKLSELNVEIVDGNSKRASAGAREVPPETADSKHSLIFSDFTVTRVWGVWLLHTCSPFFIPTLPPPVLFPPSLPRNGGFGFGAL